ncbi:MAG TPA: aminoacyl-tRNA hydrolase [Bacteroidota bacterium]
MNPTIVVGLGNPGTQYRSTRHNIGFMVVDAICDRFDISLKWGSGEFLWEQIQDDGRFLIVAKPMTYMNASGGVVTALLNDLHQTAEHLLVVVDDADLPLGKLRIRERGSHGGHNGLRSIIEDLGTEDFPRLRMGIHPGKEIADLAEFVLSPFDSNEIDTAQAVVQRAVLAITDCTRTDFAVLMNNYNN